MNPRLSLALSLTVGIVVLTGCGGSGSVPAPTPAPAPPPGTGLPPRPATLTFDAIDPCTLLTLVQQAELGVGHGDRRDYQPDRTLQGKVCDWSTLTARNRISYSISLLTNRGAEFALGAEPLRTVNGHAATTTSSAIGNATYECFLLVDTGPGQSLFTAYRNDSEDLPGMNHTNACDNAQAAAELAMTNLATAQPPKAGR